MLNFPIDLKSIINSNDYFALKVVMEKVVEIANLAAQQIIDVYLDDDFDVQIKNDKSPVTQADLLAHDLIVEQLKALSGDTPVVSEEDTSDLWHQRKDWPLYWLIDPLDGTKEFVDKNGEFTVNIALVSQGHPIMGIVQAPVLDTVYFAAKNIGAFKTISSNATSSIKVRDIPLIDDKQLFTVAIGRGCIPDKVKQLYQALPSHNTIRIGSALKTCLIAEGLADIYPRYGKTSEWDTAAAQCILECAGGVVCDMQLNTLTYNTKDSLINPEFIAYGDKSIDWSNYLD
ncbi:MAG: 3'(2'), 5'-bisphosphate nucleotidase [Enterobacterales bacterium]|jgi:3'(2'), 5'-bisphosphate nucleotidase